MYGIYGMLNKNLVKRIELEFKEYFGTEHVFFVSSGKAALLLILLALKSLSNRKNVVMSAYTCYSVPSAVVKAGLFVVPCDIRPDTLDFDWDRLEKLVDGDTLCVIPTHLFGIPSDVDRVRDICRGRGIYVVEDAAQAMGATAREEKVGRLGDVSFFSLGRGKNITCGSGGVIVANSEEIAGAVRKFYGNLKREPALESMVNILSAFLLSIFLHPYLYWFPQGLPILKLGETRFYRDFPSYRFSAFKAGLLRHWREFLGAYNHARTSAGKFYLKELKLEKTLPIYTGTIPYLRFPVYVDGHLFPKDTYRDCRFLGVSRMYPDSVNNIEELRGDFDSKDYRHSEKIAKTLWTLPTHCLLRVRDKEEISRVVASMINPDAATKPRTD